MWIHIVIFMLAFGFVWIYRAGWIKIRILGDKSSLRLFMLVAVCGNLLGMAFTAADGRSTALPEGYMLEKDAGGMYEEKLQVRVSGEETEEISVQVPGKETEQETGTAAEEEKPEETRRKELLQMIEEYNLEKQDPDYYYLPAEWNGQSLEWSRPRDHTGAFLASVSLFAAFVVLLKKTREEQERESRRAEQLLMDYPGLVMKFALLIQAGMTARRAFQKMAGDYRRRTPEAGRYAYEAMEAACHEMDSGVAETEAYRRFGERCGQMKYKTFSTLLIQNLQKGTRYMADMLEQEAIEAWDERKRKARVLGEAAATKLLLPMVMMLAVVMAIIMIPAFLSFYS